MGGCAAATVGPGACLAHQSHWRDRGLSMDGRLIGWRPERSDCVFLLSGKQHLGTALDIAITCRYQSRTHVSYVNQAWSPIHAVSTRRFQQASSAKNSR